MNEIFVNPSAPLRQLESLSKADQAVGVESRFAEILSQAMNEVNQLQAASGVEVDQILSGDIQDIHCAMLALQRADLSFQLLMQVREKLVEAYQEVMRMQV